MNRRVSLLLLALFLLAAAARGEITWTGNVDPEDPTTWTSSDDANVGNTADGTITVDDGSTLPSKQAYLGNASGVSGMATVTGIGSEWNSGSTMYVGRKGNGTLHVEAGGQVSSSAGSIGTYSGSTGTAIITGADSQWTTSSPYFGLEVGDSGSGTLRVEAGGLVSNAGISYVGSSSGSAGDATVTGTGSAWNISSYLYVGGYGSGTLTVADEGQVTATTLFASLDDLYGDGTITATEGAVLDANMRFDAATGTNQTVTFGSGGTLNVNVNGGSLGAGYLGSGSLTIADGITLASRYGYLGYHAGSTGSATVTGAGSLWDNTTELHVGRFGSGSLTVEDGGQVTARTLYASLEDLNGDGTVVATRGAVLDADLRFDATYGVNQTLTFGSGGTLNVTADGGNLGAGYKDHGSLIIADGIAVSSADGYLGYQAGSTGEATVTGAGSQWNNRGDLYVGQFGNGTLRVEAGGQVDSWNAEIGHYDDTNGEAMVTGAGSCWNIGSWLTVGREGRGTLTITDGGLVSVGGQLGIDWAIDADYVIDGFVYMNTGGMLAIAGNTASTLTNFMNQIGGLGTIHYWSTDLADWAPITDATYGDDYTLEYLTEGDLAGYTLLTVGEVPTSLPGDFNGDGLVNLADYTVWRNNLGGADDALINQAGDGLPGVSAADYEVWKSHFGEGGSLPVSVAVPEPNSLAMLLVVAGLAAVAKLRLSKNSYSKRGPGCSNGIAWHYVHVGAVGE